MGRSRSNRWQGAKGARACGTCNTPRLEVCERSRAEFAPFRAGARRVLGFVDAVVDQAGTDAYLLPEGRGRPFQFGPWVATAALGHNAEPMLPARIKQIWKTDLFLGSSDDPKYFATTVKSKYALLEGGRGLRIGIVPESSKKLSGVKYDDSRQLWIVSLADPDGFMGLFNDAYFCVARSLVQSSKRTVPSHMYFVKPSAKAVRVQEQLEKYSDALVFEVDEALNFGVAAATYSGATSITWREPARVVPDEANGAADHCAEAEV